MAEPAQVDELIDVDPDAGVDTELHVRITGGEAMLRHKPVGEPHQRLLCGDLPLASWMADSCRASIAGRQNHWLAPEIRRPIGGEAQFHALGRLTYLH